uniref:hypothetical protein n=1 Tax=Neisseria sicca TaxID=490 RepID=UPI001C9A0909
VMGVDFEFVGMGGEESVVGEGEQIAGGAEGEGVIWREVGLLVEIGYAQSRVGVDVGMGRGVEGLVVFVGVLGGSEMIGEVFEVGEWRVVLLVLVHDEIEGDGGRGG